jgi:integrase
MTGTVREARLGNPTARSRLKAGRQPHWNAVLAGRAHIGWQRWSEDRVGRWVLRTRRGGAYSTEQIGVADDDRSRPADGIEVLTYDQARSKALDLATGGAEGTRGGRLTVARAMTNYLDHMEATGKVLRSARSAIVAHVLPKLGRVEVSSLTSAQIRRWLAELASTPARKRSKRNGEQRFKDAPTDDEGVRKRRNTANRVLTVLKAALNHAYDEVGKVASNREWDRRVKKFKGVDAARVRYLSIAEVTRLLNACAPEFRGLVRAALESGCRYAELGRLEVADFNPDSGTVEVRKSKSGKSRHVVLTDQGAEFFRQVCAGRAAGELMLAKPDGESWGPSQQSRLINAACDRAKISPPITFHGLRHTWASLAVMGGVPLMVVAKNLGHTSTSMVEKFYGHMARSHVVDAIRAGAPRYGVEDEGNVRTIR